MSSESGSEGLVEKCFEQHASRVRPQGETHPGEQEPRLNAAARQLLATGCVFEFLDRLALECGA